MKALFAKKRWRYRRVWRLRFLLSVLVAASAFLLVFNLVDLIGLYQKYGSWETLWRARWHAGSGVTGVLGSGLFHIVVLVAGWSIWFRLQRRELDQIRIRRSEQKYRNIINHAGEAIFLLDSAGKVLEWNKTSERLFGVPRRSVLNKQFQDIHLCYGLEVEKAMADAAEVRRGLTFDFPFPRSGDPGGSINLTISPIDANVDRQDEPNQSFVVIARDITSEKQFESKMSETEKLAGIGQLAAGIAHELNTPLGSILLSAQMIEETVTGEDEIEDVRRIIRQTEQCRSIIKGLLNFARPTGSERGRVNIAEAISETAYLMEKSLKLANVQVEYDERTEPIVQGNRNELEQVFFNLIANAIDAMPDGGRIDIIFRNGAPGEVVVEFADTGEGIPDEYRERVFLPFFTTKEYGKGTGLGLSIVARIVHEHGGRIEMQSKRNQGTRFLLSFPRPGLGFAEMDTGTAAVR